MRSLLLVIALLSIASADKWALFVSGNSGWGNYCITSTICRGFDILHQAGVAEDHIVYMGFNKTFDNPSNPFPGKIFTDQDPEGPGVDYAAECRPHMDYGDNLVSAELFMATLSGDKEEAKKLTGMENPKVIESGPEDTVFVYYMDHGAIGFCEVGKSELSDDVLINTINKMYENKQYKQMVFYFEACHSGSMFRKLEKGKNVYAMTGSDTEHSAWMCDCPPHDKVNGKSMGTCLSAWYDNMWMEEVMKKGADISLKDMYQTVHDTVAKHTDQNVSQFGDIRTMGDLPVKEFIGDFQPQHTRPDTGTCVKYEDAARDTAKWDAIRNGANGMENYKDFVFEEAKKDISVYRLARAYFKDDKLAELAMKQRPANYDADCVKGLGLALVGKCGYKLPMKDDHVTVLENVCAFGSVNIDFDEVCCCVCLSRVENKQFL